MGNIQQKFSGDTSELERALDKMQQKYVRLEEQMAKMARASKDSSDKQIASFGQFEAGINRTIKAIGGIAAGWLSAQTAIGLYKASLDDLVQKAERARQSSMTVAEGQAAVLMNLGNVDDSNAKAFMAQIASMTAQSKFQSQAPMLTAASSILSATGGDQQKTLGILGAAAPFFRSNQSELAQFGGVLGDVMKSSGMQDPNQALAFALSVQGQSRFEQLGGFKNVSPVLAGAAIGAPQADRAVVAKQAAALFAAVGSELGDPEGGVSKTAVLKLIENLSTVTGGKGDLFQQLAAVQADPSLMTKGKDGKGWKEFEGQAKLLMEEMASNPNSQVMRSVMTAYSQISADPQMVAMKRAQLEGLTPQLAAQTAEATSAGTLEAGRLDGTRATRASIRAVLKSTLEDQVSYMNRMGDMAFFDMASDDQTAANRAISTLATHRAVMQREQLFGETKYDQAIPIMEKQIELLQKMAEDLRGINQHTGQTAKKPAGQPGGNEPD